MPNRRPWILSTLLLPVIVAACGASSVSSPPASSTAPSPTASTAPTDPPSPTPVPVTLVLRVTTEGGFIGPTATLSALPTVAVYADGRIFTPGPVDAIAPPRLLTTFTSRDVGAAGITAIEAAIRTAGLDKPAAAGPGIPGDLGTTVFDVTLDGQTTTTRLSGLGGGPGRPGGGDPATAAAADLIARLVDTSDMWGAAPAADHPYQATAYRIFVVPGAPTPDPTLTEPPLAWPLSTPLATFGTAAVPDRGITGLRSGVVFGADVARLEPFLRQATTLSPITSGGASFTLYVRPLLPDEAGG